MPDPVLDSIQQFRHDFELILAARPDYRAVRAELRDMRERSQIGPASASMSVDVIAEALSRVVQFRARATETLVTMMNYATLWNELEDEIGFEVKSIRRATSTRADVRDLTEKRMALVIDASVPQEFYSLQNRTKVQRKFAEAMKSLADREIEHLDRTYEMISRIETLILDERSILRSPRSGV